MPRCTPKHVQRGFLQDSLNIYIFKAEASNVSANAMLTHHGGEHSCEQVHHAYAEVPAAVAA